MYQKTRNSVPYGTFTNGGVVRGLPTGLIRPAGHTHRQLGRVDPEVAQSNQVRSGSAPFSSTPRAGAKTRRVIPM